MRVRRAETLEIDGRRVPLIALVLFAAVLLPSTPLSAQLTACVGDCHEDGRVDTADLLTAMRAALGGAPNSACQKADRSGDDRITVDELLTAVNTAATGCTPTPTATPAIEIIDFGLAFGVPGAQTDLPLELPHDFTIGSIHLEIEFDDDAFDFLLCSPFFAELQVTTITPQPGHVIVNIVPTPGNPSFTIPAGTFMNCAFQVTGRAGTYPVALTGAFTDDQGVPSTASATGSFNIQCSEDAHCPSMRTCASGQCVVPDLQINTFTTGAQGQPAVCSDAAGNFVVVFSNQGQVVGRRYSSSAVPLGSEFEVSFSHGYTPAVSCTSAGEFVVVWEGDIRAVRVRLYRHDGQALTEEFPIDVPGYNPKAPTVARDAQGNFVVAWHTYRQDAPEGAGVFARRFNSNGQPFGTQFQVNTYTTDFQQQAAVTAAANGNFVIAWTSYGQDGSSAGVFAQRYASSGGKLGSEFQVNSYTTDNQLMPAIASDPTGGFIVTWSSTGQDGSSTGVYARRYDNGGNALGTEFSVNTQTADAQTDPTIAAGAQGDFVIVWQSGYQDGDLDGIFAQRYASVGTPLGTEFQVNVYSSSSQSQPRVAADAQGGFVVVWSSYGQDGSYGGVFGQAFDSSGGAREP